MRSSHYLLFSLLVLVISNYATSPVWYPASMNQTPMYLLHKRKVMFLLSWRLHTSSQPKTPDANAHVGIVKAVPVLTKYPHTDQQQATTILQHSTPHAPVSPQPTHQF